ncbi:hypothetical protein [Flavobacterium sp.]|uniref:hypothetical protein n=1 Tax=Flavobacterium sp. TaxID=239 RepID=UPI00122411BF|nr:hypothetical protein [Flavobacterium sp.]RZJ71766.1 MAG: hypothetical protein EOO49_08870 [Flavobacterium sp.]
MKFNSFILFMILICSCSSDNESFDISPQNNLSLTQEAMQKTELHPASNTLNPYDYSGQLFDNLFTDYYASSSLPTSTAHIVARVNAVAESNSQFLTLKTVAYTPTTTAEVNASLANSIGCVEAFTNAANLSVKAKSTLADFINTVVPLCASATEYQTVYDYIITFESATLADAILTFTDKKVILTTSSITRYSTYRQRKKPKKKEDPEWDLITTHVTAGAAGSEFDVCVATSRALATGVAGQN